MNTNEWGRPHADHSDRAFDQEVGARVRRHRLAGGNSLSHLASVMTFLGHRWDTGIASRVELGKRRLQLREAQSLAALFGVGIDELMPAYRPDLQERGSGSWHTEPVTVIHEGQFMPPIKLDESRGFSAVRVHNDEILPPEVVEAISGEKFTPVCCSGECCGPGSHCCVNAGPHEHEADRVT